MLSSLLWCFIRAIALAAWEAVRLYLWPWRQASSAAGTVFYEGEVQHVRTTPVRHTFRYSVRYVAIELDDDASSALYAARQLAAGKRLSAAEARRLSGCEGGRVQALLVPASAGYEQNPLVVYYCHDRASGELRCCLAEVTNTPWADRVVFAFDPKGDSTPKPLHVSPLQDMRSSWGLKVTPLGHALQVQVTCTHPQMGAFFVATLHAKEASTRDPERWGFLMAHRVALWIYWHAAVLMLRKNLPFLAHPKSVAGPDYRDEVRARQVAEERLDGLRACGCPILAARGDALATGSGRRPMEWTDATDYPWT